MLGTFSPSEPHSCGALCRGAFPGTLGHNAQHLSDHGRRVWLSYASLGLQQQLREDDAKAKGVLENVEVNEREMLEGFNEKQKKVMILATLHCFFLLGSCLSVWSFLQCFCVFKLKKSFLFSISFSYFLSNQKATPLFKNLGLSESDGVRRAASVCFPGSGSSLVPLHRSAASSSDRASPGRQQLSSLRPRRSQWRTKRTKAMT